MPIRDFPLQQRKSDGQTCTQRIELSELSEDEESNNAVQPIFLLLIRGTSRGPIAHVRADHSLHPQVRPHRLAKSETASILSLLSFLISNTRTSRYMCLIYI